MKRVDNKTAPERKDDDVFTVEITRAELAIIHSVLGPINEYDLEQDLRKRFPHSIKDHHAAAHLNYDLYAAALELVGSDA